MEMLATEGCGVRKGFFFFSVTWEIFHHIYSADRNVLE